MELEQIDYLIKGICCLLDFGFPDKSLNDKSRNTKKFLIKRIKDYTHQVFYENQVEGE